ncbi:unnamed protein product [Oikopleura dioica]|uniref:Uncharacterized protein n=1 Tax=Oikopleura dioica TaxID=34765 RepID=E4WZQ9_OIKDI|nr:unnamed protein product [Oikopleura dioica]
MEDGIESPIVVNFAMVLQRLLTIKMREEEIVMAGYNVVDQAYKFSKRNSQKRQSEAKRSESLRFVSQFFFSVRFDSL